METEVITTRFFFMIRAVRLATESNLLSLYPLCE